MKLGPLIPFFCVKLQDSRQSPAAVDFFVEKWHFFVSGVCIFSTRTLPPLQNFEVQTLGDKSLSPLDLHPCFQMSGLRLSRLRGRGNTVNYAR